MSKEAGRRLEFVTQQPIQSIYFGGGTPSLWEPRAACGLLRSLRWMDLVSSRDVEVTIELNPLSVESEKVSALCGAGVSRASIGVQSLSAKNLKFLGRLHSAQEALKSIEVCRKAGLENISADLMFGLPGQTPQSASEEARMLVDEGVFHISAYMLTIEPSTPLGRAVHTGQVAAADEQMVADCYLAISDALVEAGFDHYEVSNFARSGYRCRHNAAIWRGSFYLGLGAGAVGTMQLRSGQVVRWKNRSDPDGYMEVVEGGGKKALFQVGDLIEELEELNDETLLRERIMLGLRLADGIDVGRLGEELGVQGWTEGRRRAAERLARRGRLEMEGGRIRIPRAAWLWENQTIAELL